MSHVGNDIVDLLSPYAIGKSRDKRFVDRVLTKEEKTVVLSSNKPDTYLWAFWAAKESAFKAVSKEDPHLSSVPKRYPVKFHSNRDENTGNLKGIVHTPAGIVNIVVYFTHDFCHCVGTIDGCLRKNRVIYETSSIDFNSCPDYSRSNDEASLLVRKIAKCKISTFFQLDESGIDIVRSDTQKGNEPPVVYYRNDLTNIDLSLSHDGRFVAYAFSFSGRI